jgi:putative DNA primase/helicase
MDKISPAEATKRDGQASSPLSTTGLPSLVSPAIAVDRSAPRRRACEASAALPSQPRTPPAEPRPSAVRPSSSSPAEPFRANLNEQRTNRWTMTLDPRAVARLLGGEAMGRSVLAPGPGHSQADRSLSIKIDPAARDGFIVHSFASDDPTACRDHVRHALGLSLGRGRKPSMPRFPSPDPIKSDNVSVSIALVLRIWNEAYDPHGTVVEAYLRGRKLLLSDDISGHVLRFHPALKFNGALVPGMVALFRDVVTNEPCGLHRTFLDRDGCKLGRRMLGRAKYAAVKLDHDEEVTLGLVIGEGLETGLAAQRAGFRPVWALGSAGAIASFPVLPGLQAINILGEVDDGGANQRAAEACAARLMKASQEVFVILPLSGGDFADIWRELV